jgi:DUF177 domain-containing protein
MDKREFDINIYNLSCKRYNYNYKIDRSFFDWFKDPLVQKGSLEVWVDLEKTETFIALDFQIDGSIELECDRSLDKFQHPLHFREYLIYKFGEEEVEISDDVYVIPADTQQLNLARIIYEFIRVAVPMKKLHPRYEQDFDEMEDEDEIIYSSESQDNDNQENVTIDPRWHALKKLKSKK